MSNGYLKNEYLKLEVQNDILKRKIQVYEEEKLSVWANQMLAEDYPDVVIALEKALKLHSCIGEACRCPPIKKILKYSQELLRSQRKDSTIR